MTMGIGQRREHFTGVGGAALGQDIDEIEREERPDDRHDHHQRDGWS